MFVGVNFWVMIKFFGHIHSVIVLVQSTTFLVLKCSPSHYKTNEQLFIQIGVLVPELWIFQTLQKIWCLQFVVYLSYLLYILCCIVSIRRNTAHIYTWNKYAYNLTTILARAEPPNRGRQSPKLRSPKGRDLRWRIRWSPPQKKKSFLNLIKSTRLFTLVKFICLPGLFFF